MCGPTFTLEKFLETITTVMPTNLTMGTHHFVQLAESDMLANTDTELLSSVRSIVPTGAAVHKDTVDKMLGKFKNAKVL